MKLRISTTLRTSEVSVWNTLRKTELLRHVTWPLLVFRTRDDDLPRYWPESGVVRFDRLLLLGVVPLWPHEIRFVRTDDESRELQTEESGGPVRAWNHLIMLEPLSEDSCLYTDEVEIRAGVLTVPIWLFAQLFYRYRQARWRSLARVLD